ncbi:hypothetical protein BK663_26065 [Pseudomonas lini]|uniref:Uncharacterized protein n=1 Tax=Pseudomonas lini TaxID=163011 RepID=A0A423IAU7_9PSED|nr:hypothetical protein BK663_26065 [Pseudomonas lini]
MANQVEVMLKNRSYVKTSYGDEAGCAPKKGVITSKIKGKVYFTSWSMDVKFEGENVVRHMDLRVKVVREDLVFICGQMGTLLRGDGSQWEAVGQDATSEDLWGMEWFNGELYFACDSGLFRLDGKWCSLVLRTEERSLDRGGSELDRGDPVISAQAGSV